MTTTQNIEAGTLVQADGRTLLVTYVSRFEGTEMDDLDDELELIDQATGEVLYRYVSEVTV